MYSRVLLILGVNILTMRNFFMNLIIIWGIFYMHEGLPRCNVLSYYAPSIDNKTLHSSNLEMCIIIRFDRTGLKTLISYNILNIKYKFDRNRSNWEMYDVQDKAKFFFSNEIEKSEKRNNIH